MTLYFENTLATIRQEMDGISDLSAATILELAAKAYKRGSQGAEPYEGVSHHEDSLKMKRVMECALEDGDEDFAADAAKYILDAWHEAITRKDRVAVKLDSSTIDDVCICGRSVPNGAKKCVCGSTTIDRQVYAEVHDPYAAIWAEADQTIDGSSWECPDGDNFAYAILSINKGLAITLRAEGYRLDLSNYDDHGIDPEPYGPGLTDTENPDG